MTGFFSVRFMNRNTPTTSARFEKEPGEGPVMLQAHGSKVRFRNLRIQRR